MNEVMGQEEKALSAAADLVDVARIDVTKLCTTMSDDLGQMMTGWTGAGATAFNTLMITWQDRQATILKALDDLSLALVETEKDNIATDEAERGAYIALEGRLGPLAQ